MRALDITRGVNPKKKSTVAETTPNPNAPSPEQILQTRDAQAALDLCVTRGRRWPAAEEFIVTSIPEAVIYMREVMKAGEWPELVDYAKSQVDTVYTDATGASIYVPRNFAGMWYLCQEDGHYLWEYGEGTVDDEENFNDLMGSDVFHIVAWENYRYLIYFEDNVCKDAYNTDQSMSEVFNLTPGIRDYFRQKYPYIRQWISCATDEELAPLLDKCKKILTEYTWELESDWSINDDYYYAWLADNGFQDAEGDIDWDQAPSYREYNDEFDRYMDNIEEAIGMDPNRARELAVEVSNNRDQEAELRNLDDVYIQALSEEFGSRDMPNDIVDVIKERLHIFRNTSGTLDVELLPPSASRRR